MGVCRFMRAGLNPRVVRRSNALQDWAYGRRFRYREVTGFGASPAGAVPAAALATATKAPTAGMAFAPSRALAGRPLTLPWEGPSERASPTTVFRIAMHCRAS